MSFSIIIPTYNEAKNIAILLESIFKQINVLEDEVIVVDDNSPDGTAQIVDALMDIYQPLFLLCRKDEFGLTSAIQAGINMASKKYVIWMDADFSHNPKYISNLKREMNNCEVCLCSRFLPDSIDKRELNIQKFLSILLNKMCSFVFSQKITDWTSGFICLKREILFDIQLKGYYGDYFIYLMFEIIHGNYLIKEIPYQTNDRIFGISKTAGNYKSLLYNGFFYLKAIATLSVKR